MMEDKGAEIEGYYEKLIELYERRKAGLYAQVERIDKGFEELKDSLSI